MSASIASHPVLTCDEARDFEAQFFGGDETKEWPAMQRAGPALARAVLRACEELGGFPCDPARVRRGTGETSGRGYGISHAAFTYATGIGKRPGVRGPHGDCGGRGRFPVRGLFHGPETAARLRVLTPQVLAPLAALRAAESD